MCRIARTTERQRRSAEGRHPAIRSDGWAGSWALGKEPQQSPDGKGTYPACPVDEVIQLGHHILGPVSGKMGGLGNHSPPCSLGHSRLCAKETEHMAWGRVGWVTPVSCLGHTREARS